MMSLIVPLVAVSFMGQAQTDRAVTGVVVDAQGNAIADAKVVFYAPPAADSRRDALEVEARSDAQGNFTLKIPPFGAGRSFVNWANILAYRPGLAVGAVLVSGRPPFRLALREPQPRTIKIEGASGEPVAGARVALRRLYIFGGTIAELPDSLADSVAASTGSDGKATIHHVAARDQLVAVRITADSIESQDFLLVDKPGRGSEPSSTTIRLKSTGLLAGRVVGPHGQGVANQPVEIWSKGEGDLLPPYLVRLKGGPPRTALDGSFRTPEILMEGSTYRVAVRRDGGQPLISAWTTINGKTGTLPPLVLEALRTVRGRVVDRQGAPVASARVFQTGDGPQRTSIETDADGQFALGGFNPGPVFLFVLSEGFRFQGQLIKATGPDVTVTLTRLSERPAREMRMLKDPIPIEESRALARRLVEPCWRAVVQHGDDAPKYHVLSSMVPADPTGVLETLETVKFQTEAWRFRLLREIVRALAERDFEDAAAVAESIADPVARSRALIHLVDLLPASQRDRKLPMLDRALQQARIATIASDRLLQMGEVADRWYDLGEIERAKVLFAEGLKIADQFTDKTDSALAAFAVRLARVDLPAALAIATDFKGHRQESSLLADIACRLAAENPAEAERIWSLTRSMRRMGNIDPPLCSKLAAVAPERARRALEGMPWIHQRPELFMFLALGAKTRNESAARQAFDTGMQGIDRILRERPERYLIIGGSLLPTVEQIDPALVPEMLWRGVASRTPIDDPQMDQGSIPGRLIAQLAWFDREVAAALFEPVRAVMEKTADAELASRRGDFLTWSLFDPRAAVARLEMTPIDPNPAQIARNARLLVAASLGRSHDERWHEIFK